MISFTIDLEDPTGQYAPDGRYVAMTRKILAICDEYKTRATFFVIGKVAESAPQLIKDIAAKNHEVAYHSHGHTSLTEEDPERFRRETREDKDRLEQLSGKKVIGFRAPRFSLTPKSQWAIYTLAELHFLYSSSIMPTTISRYGFPNAPKHPFKWNNALIEFPLPVADIRPFAIPYLGGIYLYGDLCGGYAILKDVYKTQVFKITQWRNAAKPATALGPFGIVTPMRIITKAPSAELRPNQKDEDSLPAYVVLDDILECLIEKDMGLNDIVARGHSAEVIRKVWSLLDRAEYKRRQAPPGVKVTRRHLSLDRRYPITNKYRET